MERRPPPPQPRPLVGPPPAARSAKRANFPAESPKFGHDARGSGSGRSPLPLGPAGSPTSGAPRWREAPQPKNEWPARDPRDTRPRPDPVPLLSPPAGHLRAWAEPGRLPGPKPRCAGLGPPPPGPAGDPHQARLAGGRPGEPTFAPRRVLPGSAEAARTPSSRTSGASTSRRLRGRGRSQGHLRATGHRPQVRAPCASTARPCAPLPPPAPHLGAMLGGPDRQRRGCCALRSGAPSASRAPAAGSGRGGAGRGGGAQGRGGPRRGLSGAEPRAAGGHGTGRGGAETRRGGAGGGRGCPGRGVRGDELGAEWDASPEPCDPPLPRVLAVSPRARLLSPALVARPRPRPRSRGSCLPPPAQAARGVPASKPGKVRGYSTCPAGVSSGRRAI